jgi:RNA polymerase sigma-70 factor (ECF subfamily)
MIPSQSLLVLSRLAAGDAEALRELYDLHASRVNGLAFRIVGDSCDAQDVVQEVFVQAWSQASLFDASRGTPEAWLYMMARSRALDRLRRKISRREAPEEAAPAATTTPKSAEAMAVRTALDCLSADQRRALELAYYQGLTQTEIAARLAVPLGTVKARVRSALNRLRSLLAPFPVDRPEVQVRAAAECQRKSMPDGRPMSIRRVAVRIGDETPARGPARPERNHECARSSRPSA